MALDPATEAARLVDSLGAEQLALAASYTRGNEWLTVAGVAISLVLAWIIVRLRVLDWLAARVARWPRVAATFTVSFGFFLIADVLRLPVTVWTDWWREKSYDMTDQPLGDFLFQYALAGVIEFAISAIFVVGVFWLVRRSPRRWWLWTGGLAGGGAAALLLLGPALIQPMFNTFQPVPPGQVRTALEAIADDVGIPHDRIFMYDGSRQSANFTANVSGIGPAARIAIADVALKSASLDEVRAVTAHEAGHYKLGHVWRHLVVMPLIAVLVAFLIGRLYPWTAQRLGATAPLGDPVGLPVFMALVSVLTLFTLPAVNSLTRMGEAEADAFAMQTVGLPDAMAGALLKTAEYRYPRPHPLEEAIFYTHPSVERRIEAAMAWKAGRGGANMTGVQ
ncbi:peptidase M48, Ste24p [Novosphingobium aromaticivorans DSM 12444]|uniref:Peptidase M48, Ste24p n=1 Tax=Novosphingobium aromaticivorans (strain ATCC 700278 / DSM 12444 / CCUG 56034 / CIP 105152 / NBRC 16084 / F199) TaxID=279238 RepID=Q2GCF6_NOVAD|nr:M48 family metalloprotease [Novosphingobium aromaticivorans]ABD24454.1 peptidase M48, Ste24p [Novosphingobium aromaticivorans DSM 12444]SCY27676.1 STE24 endopeptidase [Novosphingobium aromaticivorans]